jgi:hypothetical protein
VPIQAKAEAEAKYGTTTESDTGTESERDNSDNGDNGDAKSGANVDNNASNREIARDTE